MRQQSSQKQRSTGAFLPILILIASLALSAAAAPPEGKLYSRTLSIAGSARQPKFSLDISAARRIGKVVVNNPAGAKIQTLTCDLFRDWGPKIAVDADMTTRILDSHAGTFVSGLQATDLDFDGLPDILATRDFGAKWATYCVWLFDPNQGRFIQNPLSRQMEDLENLTVDDERHQIVAFTIGPTYPIGTNTALTAAPRFMPSDDCWPCVPANWTQPRRRGQPGE